MTPSLQGLPVELIEDISRRLPYRSLYALRLTCKTLYAATIDSFRATFSKLTIYPHHPRSIQRLTDIATSELDIGKCIEVLEFVVTLPGSTDAVLLSGWWDSAFETPNLLMDQPGVDEEIRIGAILDHCCSLMATRRPNHCQLKSVVATLSNLKEVILSPLETRLQGTQRIGPPTLRTKSLKGVLCAINLDFEWNWFSADASISILSSLLAQGQLCQLQKLNLDFGETFDNWSHTTVLEALKVEEESISTQLQRANFPTLKVLTIKAAGTPYTHTTTWLDLLLKACPFLEVLHLTDPPILFSRPVTLPLPHFKYLKEFQLHQVTISDTIGLTHFLRSHRESLVTINLYDIDVSGEGEEWPYLLETLEGIMPKLKGLYLKRLMRLQRVILEYFTFTKGKESVRYKVPDNE